MRVISGDFKGKKILEPKDIKTRPLKDLTKDIFFHTIYSNISNLNAKSSPNLYYSPS